MMNCHPEVFVFHETHWIPALHEAFGTGLGRTEVMLDIVARTRHVTGQPTTVFDMEAFRASAQIRPEMTVRAFCDTLGTYLARAESKTLWADKTPDYGYFVSQLQLYWPDCKIIHVIRDGIRTTASMAGHIGYQGLAALNRMHWCPLALDFTPPPDGFASCPISRFADLWHDRLLRIRDEATRLTPGSYLELRHEDTLADPAAQLRRVARFVGLAEDPGWLASAGALIDPTRGQRHRAQEVLLQFDDRHLRLLDALGYPTDVG